MRVNRHFRFLVALVTIFPLLAASCNSPTTPDEIAAQFIKQSEEAFEERDILGLKNLISADYQDPRNRTSGDIVSVAAVYIRSSKSLYLFTNLESAAAEQERIRARVLAAFGARPISDPSIIGQIQADIYWFDILLAEENGEWKLVEADWQQAMVDDFFKDGNPNAPHDD